MTLVTRLTIAVRKCLTAFNQGLRTPETIVALAFAICLTIFEAILFRLSLRPYLLLFQQHRYIVASGSLLIIAICWLWTVSFFRISLTAGTLTRIASLLLFILAELVGFGYQNAFAQYATVEDARIAIFDANNQQRLNSIRVYSDWYAFIPSILYAALLWRFRSTQRSSWRSLTLALAGLFIFFSALSPFTAGQFPTLSLNAFLRTASLIPWKWASGYHGPREQIPFRAPQPPQDNIIFVIDESVRGDHLSINGYQRATTPYLDELQTLGWLHNAGIASSGGTCSEKSDLLLLTGMTVEELPDTTYQLRKRASIFQYARAMGYRTHFLDAQKDTYWLGTSYDKSYVDDWRPASSFSVSTETEYDKVLARSISEITNGSVGNLVLVIKRGIHYPYTTSFPLASAVEWLPSDTVTTEIDPAKRDQLANTYDNALRYNLEMFFRSLEISQWHSNTVLLYTSDHGQTLSEHGERHTHCGSSSDTAPTEALVPLFLISRRPITIDNRYRASHANVFATLLDLMEVPREARLHSYARSLFEAKAADSRPRYFWVGDLYEKALNGRIPFD